MQGSTKGVCLGLNLGLHAGMGKVDEGAVGAAQALEEPGFAAVAGGFGAGDDAGFEVGEVAGFGEDLVGAGPGGAAKVGSSGGVEGFVGGRLDLAERKCGCRLR